MVLLVSFDHVRNLGLARTAPRGPEIDQDPLAFAGILAQPVEMAVRILRPDIHETLADQVIGSLGLAPSHRQEKGNSK